MKMLQHYYDEWCDDWTKQGWLDYLLNTYGQFKIAYGQRNPDQTEYWTKHIPYSDLQFLNETDNIKKLDNTYPNATKKDFIAAANNRTILHNEIILDIDHHASLEPALLFLNKHEIPYENWTTGSRGNHIHIIEPELSRYDEYEAKLFKERFIFAYDADLMKKSTKTMIALENTPHWKTGQPKRIVP